MSLALQFYVSDFWFIDPGYCFYLLYNEIQVVTTFQRFLSLAQFVCSYWEEKQRCSENPPGDRMSFKPRFWESDPGCVDARPECWPLGQPARISFRSGNGESMYLPPKTTKTVQYMPSVHGYVKLYLSCREDISLRKSTTFLQDVIAIFVLLEYSTMFVCFISSSFSLNLWISPVFFSFFRST